MAGVDARKARGLGRRGADASGTHGFAAFRAAEPTPQGDYRLTVSAGGPVLQAERAADICLQMDMVLAPQSMADRACLHTSMALTNPRRASIDRAM